MKKEFLEEIFSENDNSVEEYKKEFTDYLEKILKEKNWEAMSDYTLYLQGAKKALEEVLQTLKT